MNSLPIFKDIIKRTQLHALYAREYDDYDMRELP